MKKIILLLFVLLNISALSALKDPFKDEKFEYVFKNVPEVFGGDFRCKFIIKQVLLRSFHIDNQNKEMIDTFNDSLKTYGRIIQLEGEFEKESDPVVVTDKYYAKNCFIPEQKWTDYINSPALNDYFKMIQDYKNRKKL